MLRVFHKDNDVLVKNKFYLELLKKNKQLCQRSARILKMLKKIGDFIAKCDIPSKAAYLL